MLTLVTLFLLALAAPPAAGSGERQVNSTSTSRCQSVSAVGEDIIACTLPDDVKLEIKTKKGQYVRMYCNGAGRSSLQCSSLPHLALGHRNEPSVALYECPGSLLSCAAGALGAGSGGAKVLRLEEADVRSLRAALEGELHGLEAVESLDFYWFDTPAEDSEMLPIPTAALTSLPALRRFSVKGARVALDADSFVGSPPLRYLELASARIQELPRGVFSPLASLETLNIWRNDLDNLTSDAFEGLSSLKNLSLDMNPLTSLRGVFRSTPLLRRLNLKSTKLSHIDNETFTGLANLEELQMSSQSKKKRLEVRSRAFASLPALQTLVMKYCGVTSLPEDALDGSAAIQWLYITYTKLQRLPEALFRSQANLKLLDLSYNELQELPKELFWPLKKLKELKLDHNKLRVLPGKMLESLSRIEHLSASNNMLVSLSSALLGASSITRLDLAHNQLTLGTDDLPPMESTSSDNTQYINVANPLNSLVSAVWLDLGHNLLRFVPSDLTDIMNRLQYLNLAYNNFTTLTSFDLRLASIYENVTMDLRHNQIANVSLDPVYRPGLLPPLPHEHSDPGYRGTLLLDHNPFNCDCHVHRLMLRLAGSVPLYKELKIQIDGAKCASPPRLANAPLRNVNPAELTCALQDCTPGCSCTLRPATSALEMTCESLPHSFPDPTKQRDVKGIELRLLSPPTSLEQLPDTVRALNLSALSLTDPPDVPSNVSIIDLSNNLLERPPLGVLASNVSVYLAGNPLACDCWHRSDMVALQEYSKSVLDASLLRCGAEPLQRISAARLCDTALAASIGGTLALLGLIVALVALLMCRYSLQFRVWLYWHGLFRPWLKEEDIDENKKYDAFVSFAHKDADFVLNLLMPRLEAPPHSFKLCVHHRDWIIGEFIPAQIARSVEESRRTIVILSKNFLDSIWGREEFRTSHTSAVKEHRSRVIVVLLDDVTGHDALDAEMRAYLATNTYLRWGEPKFWERLIYALPYRSEAKHRRKGEEIALRLPLKQLAARHVARPDVKLPPDALVGVKLDRGLDARLNRDGKIVNAAALTAPVV